MEAVEINGRGLIDPPIYRAAAQSHCDVVWLSLQQGTRLNINEGTIASHDTALCIAVRVGDARMVQKFPRLHDQIDFNVQIRCFKNSLTLAVRGGDV
ncbi:unnamed protein product [Penicillium salamii]|uniref:Uncharacterized protein n=1 Tax=Penicillium salamii TaxID=1612424 RepID=A0A9W4I1Y1_9EURO|nr:unnamed protein product [Penicillium salamii]CAG8217719.1 unnamed protein product [Penicillium salamii]CAG8221390.1 unnamed protein product [Penicillium salamii]CAG8344852.1 unnamed protein product [Penicillium salamii]CAG8418500.1 unnamed protein product [Penicillium salamii]